MDRRHVYVEKKMVNLWNIAFSQTFLTDPVEKNK